MRFALVFFCTSFVPNVWAAQSLEVIADQVLIMSAAEPESDPIETAQRGDIYRGSDRTYRGFYKVSLKKNEETVRFGWIPENTVRVADPAAAAAAFKGKTPVEQSKFSVEALMAVSSYSPTDLQEALGAPVTSVVGTGFGVGVSLRIASDWRIAFQANTFGIPTAASGDLSYRFSGNQLGAFIQYDLFRISDFGMSAELGGGAVFGSLEGTTASAEEFFSPSVLAGFWNPRVGFRWNIHGPWTAHLRASRVLVTELKQTVLEPAVFLDLSSWQGQMALSFGF